MLNKINKLKSILFISLSMLIICISVLAPLAIHYFNLQAGLNQRYYELKVMSQEIAYYDEVLTMSARMYAYAEDSKWLVRYKKNEILLGEVLDRAVKYDILVSEAINITSSANNALIDMEKRAFDLVQENKKDQASALLSSAIYQEKKQQYTKGMQLAMEKVLSIAERDLIEGHRTKANTFVFAMLLFIVVFLFLWFYLVRYIRSTDKHINSLVQIDELSCLFNRRVFNEMLPVELQRCERDGNIVMLAILDIDNFKSYNDNYGHLRGDRIINAFGQVLLECTRRASDSAFRIGGEEFAVIVSSADKQSALKLVEKILKTVEELDIPHEKNHPFSRLTISVGASFSHGISSTAESKLFKQADSALYKAKGAGRNKFICHDGNT